MMAGKVDKVPFEEALNITGFGKFNYVMLMLSNGILMSMAFETMSVAYLVPASACDLGSTGAQQGLMAALPLAGMILTSNIVGYMADTRGRKTVLLVSIFCGFVTAAIAAFSNHWILFCVLKIVSSCVQAGTFPIAVTLLGECTPQSKRSMLIILSSSIFVFSTGIMAMIAVPILRLNFAYQLPLLGFNFTPWRALALVFSLPCLFCFFGLLFSFESPKYLLSIGEHEKAMDTLRGFYVINSGKSADCYMVNSVVLDEQNTSLIKGFWSSVKAQTVPLFRPPLLKNTVLLSVMFSMVYLCLHPSLVWLPYISNGFMVALDHGGENMTICNMLRLSKTITTVRQVTNKCALDETAMTLVFACTMILTVLNITSSFMLYWVGRKRLFLCVQFVSGLAGISVNFSTYWVLTLILFLFNLSAFMNFSSLSTYSVDLFPTYLKAMAVSLLLMFGRGSAIFGVNVMKNLLDNNCETTFYLFGGLTILGGLIAILLPSDAQCAKQQYSES